MAMKGQKANGRKLQARAMAWGLGPWPALRAMPAPWPRHKPNRQRPKANGHKLEAMAQDIRYLGVRVGEASGQQTALVTRD